MRKLFVISTMAFWVAVTGFWLTHSFPPPEPAPAAPPGIEPNTIEHTLTEVARHDREADCWMAIEGQVYDISAYLPEHPSEPELILPWCGKEATQAWLNKGNGHPHSARAHRLLAKYRIASLAEVR